MREKQLHMIGMGMPVELTPNRVGVTVSEGVESHRPFVQGIARRDVADDIDILPNFLRLFKF